MYRRGTLSTQLPEFDEIKRLQFLATRFRFGMFPKKEASLKDINEFAHYQDDHKNFQIADCQFCKRIKT